MSEVITLLNLLLAAILGGLIGYERKVYAKKEAGLRTYMLVSLAAAFFTMLAVSGFGQLNASVAGGIVTGIGFLGAGMIITHAGKVEGLTTAAGLWTVAAIGMAVGVGWYLVAAVATLGIFASLLIMNKYFCEL